MPTNGSILHKVFHKSKLSSQSGSSRLFTCWLFYFLFYFSVTCRSIFLHYYPYSSVHHNFYVIKAMQLSKFGDLLTCCLFQGHSINLYRISRDDKYGTHSIPTDFSCVRTKLLVGDSQKKKKKPFSRLPSLSLLPHVLIADVDPIWTLPNFKKRNL